MGSAHDRSTRVEHTYNRHFKGYVPPTYDTEPLPLARCIKDGVRLQHFVELAPVHADWGIDRRPAFRGLRTEADAGRIDRVVVRHLGRLARDREELI